MNGPILFDAIPDLLVQLVRDSQNDLDDLDQLWAVRDLFGRVRFLVGQRPRKRDAAQRLKRFAQLAKQRLGRRAYPPEQAFLYREELATDGREPIPAARSIWDGPPRLLLLDRQVTGLGWATTPEPVGGPFRLAFYSLKGGVGRSTAVAVTAWHLARTGRTVLVLDLDLEAPGLSTSLLPNERAPEYGIADWFVEDAVGQGDAVVPHMVSSSPLAHDLRGQIWVTPGHGADAGDYLAKLGRCYLDLPRPGEPGRESWEQRLLRLIGVLEKERSPDVVLLDVRAGLADLSSVPVTDLGADVLLFALDTDQTWAGYRLLLEHWRRTEAIRTLRDRLQIVSALVPETDRSGYLEGFRQRAWTLFCEHAYDEAPPPGIEPEDVEPFSFDLADQEAPHAPVPIYWHRGFAGLRNLHELDETLVEAAFRRFLDHVDLVVTGGEGGGA